MITTIIIKIQVCELEHRSREIIDIETDRLKALILIIPFQDLLVLRDDLC